ncbi:MAG: hypothetical protein Q9226_007183 [Calogaya cf. arnoldii]
MAGTTSFLCARESLFSHQITFSTKITNKRDLRSIIASSLKAWPIFRCLCADSEPSTRLWVILKHTETFLNLTISEYPEVEDLTELAGLSIEPKHVLGHLPESVSFRAVVADVKSTGKAGFVMLVNQPTIFSHCPTGRRISRYFSRVKRLRSNGFLSSFLQTLIIYIKTRSLPNARYPSTSAFSAASPTSARHCGLLILPSLTNQKSRAPTGRFQSREAAYATISASPPFQTFHQSTTFPHRLSSLPQSRYSTQCKQTIPTPSSQCYQPAGPGPSPEIAYYLPNPLNIAGPTFTLITSILQIDTEATAGTLLHRVKEMQKRLTEQQHVPPSMQRQLNAEDREAWRESTHQIFNWLPFTAVEQEHERMELELVKKVGYAGRVGKNFMWEGGLMDDKETLKLKGKWDPTLFSNEPVDGVENGDTDR